MKRSLLLLCAALLLSVSACASSTPDFLQQGYRASTSDELDP